MAQRYPKPCDSKRIASVALYEPRLSLETSSGGKGPRINAFLFVFIAAYAYLAYWIISTVGLPYRQFLEKAEREGFEG